MTVQNQKMMQYLRLSDEIDQLEKGLPNQEAELKNRVAADYARLKRELGDYISRIHQTVETVCNLYRGRVQMKNGRVCLPEGPLKLDLRGSNPCALAVKAQSDCFRFLSAVLQKNHVDSNLREFAIRYNTLVDIYTGVETLQTQAITSAVANYQAEITALKIKRGNLFPNDAEMERARLNLKENSDRLCKTVILNNTKDMETEFVTHIALPLGYTVCDENIFDGNTQEKMLLSSLDWKLQEDGILVIRSDGQDIDSDALSGCVVNTITQFLFSYPVNSKRILLCDSCASHAVTTFAGVLKRENNDLFFDNADGSYTKNTDDEIRGALSELNRIINERIMVLGQSHCANTLEYNQKNQDNPLPVILALLNGYPYKYENVRDDLASMLKNGKAAGVFFLITENTYEDEELKYYRKRLPELRTLTDNIVDFRKTGQKGCLFRGDTCYLTDTRGPNYDLNAIVQVLKSHTAETSEKVLYLDSVVDREDFATSSRRKQYSKTLAIPFGKQGANPVTLELNADGPDAHLAVIGTTGSGKTAFINSLVLSACKLYAPSELELHLIVMVKGDFKIFEEQGLPHLKTIVTGDRIFAANDVLDFLDEEMKRRGALIGSYGNIYAYNEVASTPLPRCVIVIDEFYQLVQGSDDAVERINRIAQLGRAYGISLVVSSIRFPMEVNSLIPLFVNRIEFKSGENAGQLIPQAAARQSELEGAKGQCFLSKGGNMHSVTVAYSEEGQGLAAHIQEIKDKFPHCRMRLQSEIKAQRISREEDVPFSVRRAKANYDEEGILRTRLGRTYLSGRMLEYAFDAKNHLLFLFGHYLDTKQMEASLIKDTLVLSDVDEPSVYYIDYNKNVSLKRAKTPIKRLRDGWVLSGKMVYSGCDEAEDALEEIRELIHTRQEDEESSLHPVLVVIAKADELFADGDLCDNLCQIMSRGKECNVYFAIQCNELVSFYGSEKYVIDAIIFPDRYSEGDENYASTALCAALETMPAGATEKGRKLLHHVSLSALHPKLHILCNNHKLSLFIPYEYDENYLLHLIS